MNELNTCLKKFNLSFTETINIDECYGKDLDIDNIEINRNNCISLYDLIEAFNRMHRAFKSEYNHLNKLDLGKEINVLNFIKYEEELRVLDMLVYKPSMINEKYTYLYLREVNGKIMPYITNEIGFHSDNGFYRVPVKLPVKSVKAYLDLFEKYELLFELYKSLGNRIIYNDGTNMLYTRIDSANSRFLDDLSYFKVGMDANYFMKPGNHIDINVKLGKKITVDYEGNSINLNGKTLEGYNSTYLNILKNIYVNGRFLNNERFQKETEHDYVKVLSNNS